MESLEITVGERAHIAARLDIEGVLARWDEGAVLGRSQVQRDVAPDEVTLA